MESTESEEDDYDIFSDDSSFYGLQALLIKSTPFVLTSTGDDDLRAELEEQAAAFNPSAYWPTHHLQLSVLAHNNKMAASNTITTVPKPAVNLMENQPSGRHLSESVSDFLTRLPPRTTQIADAGPWIYISHFYTAPGSDDQKTFKARGTELLHDYKEAAKAVEKSMAGNAKNGVTRQLDPLRKQLESDIFKAARETGCVSGKWMLFPSPQEVDRCWRLVAEGTAAGQLGFAAKVATDDGSHAHTRLICIYTLDFGGKADVKRVVEKLVEVGLVKRSGAIGEGRAIYYKADCYTYLDITGGNEWGLKPSLYSSRDLLGESR
ncbi:hypothetical protein MMC21_001849 [Puttea exsequens]|nr:hypothetical protein [Puttea exsequens]